ncbi:hypothetical protein GGR50DRAFT_695170 [Xylaria sp. CBS 124048]|nr:hypothetical protein GGR50DRAFT_695170 [Xylaria sp. CBS 124048]
MSGNNTEEQPVAPRNRGRDVTIEGITLNVPDDARCWHFKIIYACGCSAYRTLKVKKDNHSGPCCLRGCVRGYQNHVMPYSCRYFVHSDSPVMTYYTIDDFWPELYEAG